MKHITVHQFETVLKEQGDNTSYAFINVCTPDEYKAEHITGVENVPLSRLEEYLDALSDKQHVYVHCRSGRRAQDAIYRLQDMGIEAELVNVDGGLMAWSKAGLLTNKRRWYIPLQQQVFVVVGLLLILIQLGVLFIDVRIGWLNWFLAGGLLTAGLTGWCGMAILLSKIPWNR